MLDSFYLLGELQSYRTRYPTVIPCRLPSQRPVLCRVHINPIQTALRLSAYVHIGTRASVPERKPAGNTNAAKHGTNKNRVPVTVRTERRIF